MKTKKHDCFYVLINGQETTVTESQLSDLLSNAYCGVGFGCWGASIPQNYLDARAELLKEGVDEDDICREDVWARVLMKGQTMSITDPEDDDVVHEISVKNIAEGLEQYFKEAPANGCSDIDDLLCNGDSEDADCVMQYAAYGEIVFG